MYFWEFAADTLCTLFMVRALEDVLNPCLEVKAFGFPGLQLAGNLVKPSHLAAIPVAHQALPEGEAHCVRMGCHDCADVTT